MYIVSVLRNRVLCRKGFLFALSLLLACAGPRSGAKIEKPLQTEHVIIVVIDGTRWSETWGATPGLIPNMSTRLKGKGSFLPNFFNDGYTYTNSGHAAITTGVNQPIDNYGEEFPANPSIFQYFLKQSGKPVTAAWIVSSKDKLHILANTLHPDWQDMYQPSVNAGVNGPGTGYRMDSLTLIEAKRILATHKPNLMLINFMEPDGYAHAGNWDNYLRGISRGDRYVKELWDFLRKDKAFRKKTTLFITTDHGRHLDGIKDGWVNHGDHCAGCEQIYLLALGPDFRRGEVEARYTLIDIAPTVGRLLNFEMDSLVLMPADTTVVPEMAMDTTLLPQTRDSLVLESELDTTVMKARVIKELFKKQ